MNVTKSQINSLVHTFMVCTCLICLASGCSHETATYDELEEAGKVESIARKRYAGFFRSIQRLNNLQEASPGVESDSTLIHEVAASADRVLEDMRSFPTTLVSRIAFDAFSFAAHDLTVSPGFSREEAFYFWQNGLLDPIFTKARSYIGYKESNESTHYQLVKAIQRGIGIEARNDMLLDIIPIIGPAPSEKVMELCGSDSLALKKIHDLLIYTRSLQEVGPPLWMVTGAWFLAVDIKGLPLQFFCLKPLFLDESLYLTFRDYSPGEVYVDLFDDPASSETSQMDAWLSRASAAMDSLLFNDDFAEKILTSKLPTHETHNFFNDYLLITKADSVKKEFRIAFKREQFGEGAFQFAGVDSLDILFSIKEIVSQAETITPLTATQYQGDSLVGGRLIPAQESKGMAFIMPMGVHDENKLKALRESKLPTISVSAPK